MLHTTGIEFLNPVRDPNERRMFVWSQCFGLALFNQCVVVLPGFWRQPFIDFLQEVGFCL